MARFHDPPLARRIGEDLVLRGFLVAEIEASRMDVILMGGAFRYTPAFWQHLGALERTAGGCGWRVAANTPERLEVVRAGVVGVWLSAGAPLAWSETEASAAVESLLAHGACTSLGIEEKIATRSRSAAS